jgi:hypothetical protein
MTLSTEQLEKLASPKAPRKGATEERIFADLQKQKTTAELVAGLQKKSIAGSVRS